jgi:ATP-dependent DNA helicase PIF1
MNRSELSLEQEVALQLFEDKQNVLITGPAGTGKTCLIKQIINSAERQKRKIQVCAMTGCAAILLGCNASTIHSWSGMRLAKGTVESIYENISKNRKVILNWRSTKVLIIDEISMMSMRIFEILNHIGQRVRNSTLPFGGLQVVFTGDFYQLPPVGGLEANSEKFCFESQYWTCTFPWDNHISLKTIFRQKDPVYKEILNNIREGYVTERDKHVLEANVKRKYDKDEHNGCVPTKLYAITRKVEQINREMFDALEGIKTLYEYENKTNCSVYIESGGKRIPTDIMNKCIKSLTPQKEKNEIEYLLNNCPIERYLSLKIGANVMCTVNLDIDVGICNGSIGVVEQFTNGTPPMPIVLFSNGIKMLMPIKYWQSEEYPTIAIGQLPLRLAWAMTIHKSQGATLPMAEIDIGNTIFECGQTYVALSRVQSLDGLYLSGFQPNKIKIHTKVKDFYEKIPKIEYEEVEHAEETQELSGEKYIHFPGSQSYETTANTQMNDENIKTITI